MGEPNTRPGPVLVPQRAGDPGWVRLRHLVLTGVASPHSRRAYARALDDFFAWWAETPVSGGGGVGSGPGGLSKAVVQAWRAHLEQAGLAASTINVRLAAVRKLAAEAVEHGLLDPALGLSVARVRGAKQRGVRAGNWLTREQARSLLSAPDPGTLRGRRDRALLGLLLGCGLRRAELVGLTRAHLQEREGRWVLVDVAGKGGRVRTLPVPAWVKVLIDDWLSGARIREGRLFRAVDKAGRVWGEGLSEKVVWWVVLRYARPLGLTQLAPHDLRRTCAKLCRASGGELEQIQLLLGHASVQTTERYLGTRQNLQQAVNDRLGLAPEDP